MNMISQFGKILKKNMKDYFRAKKQEYKFEDMRVRNLKSMNNLNLMLQLRMGHLAYLGEQVEESILCTKI